MKALITAGGKGTRLRPLTHTKNKHLLPIGNKPIIFHAIEDCVEAGIQDIIISLNKGDKEVPVAIGDGSRWGVKITYQEQEAPLGLGYVLKIAQPLIGDDSFVFYYGDNVFTGGLKKHLRVWEKSGNAFHLCLVKVADPQRYGIVELKDNKIVRTVEKPTEWISDLAITGIQFYKPIIFEAIKHIKPTPPKAGRTIAEMDIPPANQWLIDNGYEASYSVIDGWFKDTGKPEALLAANHLVLEELKTEIHGELVNTEMEGKISVGVGTVIENSTLRGPVIIGDNCKISNAYIGPFTSISNDCELNDCEVENSIVMSGAKVFDLKVRLDSSLIGYNTVVTTKETKPRSLNLFIGDNSEVKIP